MVTGIIIGQLLQQFKISQCPLPILNLIAIQPKSCLYGALNWRQNPFINERNNQLGLVYRGSGRRNERRRGHKAQTGTGI